MKRLLLIPVLFFAGCSTYADLSHDRVARTLTTEERSPFGTNMGFSKVQHCDKKYDEHGFFVPVNCVDVTPWTPMWSQGQGGQVLGGVAAGAGAAIGGALVDTGASVTQTVIQSTAGKGHK